jgi:tyrosyl-tRNA synthetase
MATTLEKWKQCGLIFQSTSDEIDLDNKSYTFYTGYDPTADSLHVGHLFALITMVRLQKLGHRPIAVVGGATGMIGDPSGKSKERVLLDEKSISHNVECLRTQISHFIDTSTGAEIVNNYDWFKTFGFIEFLRDVGKSFRVTEMLAKESVQKRISSDEGISFTEFSYQLLQSYDFYHLCEHHGCNLQVGGSDQWGNITAGIDFVRKKCSKQTYGLTLPLIQNSNGEKFGKSEGNAVWLDPEKTSPYNFYQFWIRTEDTDVIKFLRFYTFLDDAEIDELEQLTKEQPEQRAAQKKLAYEVTKLVHGQSEADKAVIASKVLFGGEIASLSDDILGSIFSDVPSCELELSTLKTEGYPLLDALTAADLCPSKGKARQTIRQGGIYLNNNRIDDENLILTPELMASESMMVLRSGKKKYCLLKFL